MVAGSLSAGRAKTRSSILLEETRVSGGKTRALSTPKGIYDGRARKEVVARAVQRSSRFHLARKFAREFAEVEIRASARFLG